MSHRGITPAAVVALAQGDLKNFTAAMLPGGIEAQEREGQEALVATFDRLPLVDGFGKPVREHLVAMGFQIHERIDKLFYRITPPSGWSIEAEAGNSMSSAVRDEQGRPRITVFYKAAFYDQRAHIAVGHRYRCSLYVRNPQEPESVYEDGTYQTWVAAVLRDGQPWLSFGVSSADDWERRDALQDAICNWLSLHKPEWRNPLAYWDEA